MSAVKLVIKGRQDERLPLYEGRPRTLLLFFLALLVLPLVMAPLNLSIVASAVGFAVAGTGVSVAFSSAGVLALTQPASMILGLLGARYATVEMGWPFPLALLVVPVVVALISLPLGWLTSKLDAFAFAVLGFAFTGLVTALASGNLFIDFTGGELGLPVPPATIAGTELSTRQRYLFVIVVAGVATVILRRLVRSSFGRGLLLMRDDDVVAVTMGMHVARSKMVLAVFVGYTGGLAGILVGQATGYASPGQFSTPVAVMLLATVLVGGDRYALGPFVGALLLFAVPDLLSLTEVDKELIAGAMLLASLLVSSSGLLGVTRLVAYSRGSHG